MLASVLPAHAVIVAPSTRTFGAVIDEPATWEPESGCDQTEKKGPKRLRKLLLTTYGLLPSNILRPCTSADSGHEEGRALDWMVNVRVPEQRATAEAFLAWLQAPDEFGNPSAMARRLGISYLIWNNAMWRPSTGAWTPYRDCALPKRRFKKYDNTCHRNHVHTSFSWDGALGRTSFYTGFVACPEPLSEPWIAQVPPVVVPAAPEVVPLGPVRVLDSRTGAGLPAGPCRVHPDVPVDVPVLGALPPEVAPGVAAVTLRVALDRLDAPTELHVWTAGTAAPTTPQVALGLAGKGAPVTTEVTVPVGPDGLVSLALGGGMGHVAVDVVGYSLAAAPAPVVPPAT